MIRYLIAGRYSRLVPAALGLAAVFGLYAALATYYQRVGMMAPDESFYTLAARLVFEGELPYRDFAYTQTPHLPYLNGLLMQICGYGMGEHRAINAVWGGLGLLALALGLARRTGRLEPGLMAVFAVAASPRWVSLQALAVWCGPAGALVNGALAAVLWGGPRWRRVWVFAACGALAIGCRLSCAPVIAVLAVALLVEAPGWRERARYLAAWLAVGAALFLPFVFAAPSNFVFGVWQFHLESGIERNFEAQAMQWWNVAPAAMLLCAAGLLGVPALVRARRQTELVVLAAGLIGVTTPMIPESAWGVYVAAGAPVAAAGGVGALWATGHGAGNPFRHVVWLLPCLSLLLYLPFEVREGAATEAEEIGAFIRDEAPPGPLLTPATIVAVEAGRPVLSGTELGTFAALHPRDAARAARVKMTTVPELVERIRAGEPAAIVRMVDPQPWIVWNWRWAMPSLDDQPIADLYALEDAISECYEPVWRTMTMEVLFPRE